MRNYVISLSLLVLWSTPLFAVDTVRINPDVDLVVTGTTNTTFPINSAKSTVDPTTEAVPATVYVPMDGPLTTSGSTFDEAKYFTEKGVTAIFDAVTDAKVINFPLYLNVGGTDMYLYVAVREGSSTGTYKIARQRSVTPYNSRTNYNEIFSVSPKDFCTQITGACALFAAANESKYDVYFFLWNSSGLGNADITPAAYPGGAFFEVNLSNRVNAASFVTPVIVGEIRPGDKRVMIKYSSAANISKPKAVRVFNHDGAPGVATPSPIQEYYTSTDDALLPTEYPYEREGEVTVTDLVNGSTYNFSILFTDMYKFGTVLSLPKVGEPKEIAELLKKNACFLLTAGFGEDHFVINYFRHFRDTVLMNSFLGKKFVSVYYELAPKYALMIYQHDSMRAMIRGGAYVLYFIFNYFTLIFLSIALLLPGIYLYKNKDKIKI
jgi:hypothetical protein